MVEKKTKLQSEEKESAVTETVVEEKKETAKVAKEEVSDEVAAPKEERAGIAHIYASGNNTIVHITDLAGATISRVSGGMITKHDRLKSNPTVAMFVAKKAAERARDLGINSLYIRLRGETGGTGIGPGGHAVVKSLSKEGFRVVNVLDTTRVARGGPKRPGGKRGRRV
jgi:small subunit ribosomal protein S11